MATLAPMPYEPQAARPARKGRWRLSIFEQRICTLLFAVMAFYGPALTALGQLRYVEILIVSVLLLKLPDAWREMLPRERWITYLFGITAGSQVLSDLYNDADINSTLKRAGTYLIMAALIIALRWIIGDRKHRLQWLLLGYAASYVMIIFIGGAEGAIGEIYTEQPWRLGLGFAVTLAVCILTTLVKRLQFAGPWLLVLLAVIHLFAGARAMALFTLIAAVCSLVGVTTGSSRPPKPGFFRTLTLLFLASVAAVFAYIGMVIATNNRWMPTEELQQKMEMQLDSPYGLLAAARPDTAAALFAISKNPVVGYGSSGYDYEVYRFYSMVSASSFFGTSGYDSILQSQLNKEWELAIPSHSHIFGAWVDAGFLACISWLVVLWMSIFVLLQSVQFKSEWAALFCFIAANNMWDLPFSPGPIRMDMALRIVVLFFAYRMMNPPVPNRKRRPRRRVGPDPRGMSPRGMSPRGMSPAFARG